MWLFDDRFFAMGWLQELECGSSGRWVFCVMGGELLVVVVVLGVVVVVVIVVDFVVVVVTPSCIPIPSRAFEK